MITNKKNLNINEVSDNSDYSNKLDNYLKDKLTKNKWTIEIIMKIQKIYIIIIQILFEINYKKLLTDF